MIESVILQTLVRRLPTPTTLPSLLKLLSDEMAPPTGLASSTLEQALTERLRRGGVATPEGVAFPHAVINGVHRTVVGLLLVPGGVQFDPGQPPSDLVFAIAGDAARPWEHVRLLARLSRITVDEGSRRRLRACQDDASLLATLLKEDAQHG